MLLSLITRTALFRYVPLLGWKSLIAPDVGEKVKSPICEKGLLGRLKAYGALVGPRRNLPMPGVGVTVGGQIEALRKVAGDKAVALIREAPDAAVAKIVAGWPTRFEAKRAQDLGFQAERTFDEIIAVYVDEELGGRVNAVLFSPAFSKDAGGGRDTSHCLLDPRELAEWMLADGVAARLGLQIHKFIWDPAMKSV